MEDTPIIIVAADTCLPITYHATGLLSKTGAITIEFPFVRVEPEPIKLPAVGEDARFGLSHYLLPDGTELPLPAADLLLAALRQFEIANPSGGSMPGGPLHFSDFHDVAGFTGLDRRLLFKLQVGDSCRTSNGSMITRRPNLLVDQ